MPRHPHCIPGFLAGCVALALLCGRAHADEERAREVRRALTLLGAAAEEYREGVADGEIVDPIEYEEARLFLDEAESRLADTLGSGAAEFRATFESLGRAVADKAPVEQVVSAIDQLAQAISESTGVAGEVFPAEPPSPERGRVLYAENCASCHGENADGRGPDAAGLARPPANFTDREFMRGETPYDFFHVITVGRRRSSMPAWGEVFSLQERWDLVAHLWSVTWGSDRLNEGREIYGRSCAGCHGAAGEGGGPFAAHLSRTVPRIDEPSRLTRRTDADLFAAIAAGVHSAPASDSTRLLAEDDLWAAVAFTRFLSVGTATEPAPVEPPWNSERRFAGLVRLLADEVRSDDPAARTTIPVLHRQVEALGASVLNALAEDDPTGAVLLRERLDGLSEALRRDAPAAEVAARALSLADSVADRAAEPEIGEEALGEVRRLLAAALAAYRSGDARAVYMVSDAYFQFEPLEKRLALTAPDVTRRVESRFLDLRGLLGRPGNADAAAAVMDALEADLDAAKAALVPRPTPYAVAVQSATIILREGFEVVLILGALIAYVVKSGNPHMKPPILWGAAAGLATSLFAAYLLGSLLQATGAAVEALEGVTMLLASAVLFSVSYWLISKAEAEKWQRYIQGKVKVALARGSAWALAGAAFLAVFREGVETVLFYQALFASAPGDSGVVLAGFAGGSVVLVVVCVLFIRFGMRIPIRPFFLGTSILLYYLAFVFAGRGIAELQEAGWIRTTPLAAVPRIDLLGIHPTLEGALVQGVLLACLLYAIFVSFGGALRVPAKGAGGA
jgi:high-affinity iron transporter